MANYFKDEFVPNMQGAPYHKKWVQSNPTEAAKWSTFRDAAIAHQKGEPAVAVPTLSTKYGKALVAAGKEHMSVTDIGSEYNPPPPPDPPPSSTAYFIEDWSTGRFETRWDSLFSYGPGTTHTPTTGTSDGRVTVVNDPAGGGGKCARVEIRDSDPGWADLPTLDKSEINIGSGTRTWNGTFTFGTIRWFEWSLYFPYTTNEKFNWAHGGAQPFMTMFGLHPPNSFGWSAIHVGWEAFQFNSGGDSYQDKNVYLPFRAEGGPWTNGGPNPNDRIYHLLPLTDANGARIMANHNRWIHLVWGAKFNSDSTGWLEIWVDGVNVLPRVNRATSWDNDGQNYFKYGLYNKSDATYPDGGRTVCYIGRTTIGTDRPF